MTWPKRSISILRPIFPDAFRGEYFPLHSHSIVCPILSCQALRLAGFLIDCGSLSRRARFSLRHPKEHQETSQK